MPARTGSSIDQTTRKSEVAVTSVAASRAFGHFPSASTTSATREGERNRDERQPGDAHRPTPRSASAARIATPEVSLASIPNQRFAPTRIHVGMRRLSGASWIPWSSGAGRK